MRSGRGLADSLVHWIMSHEPVRPILAILRSQSIQPFQIVTTVIITPIALNTALPKLSKILG